MHHYETFGRARVNAYHQRVRIAFEFTNANNVPFEHLQGAVNAQLHRVKRAVTAMIKSIVGSILLRYGDKMLRSVCLVALRKFLTMHFRFNIFKVNVLRQAS